MPKWMIFALFLGALASGLMAAGPALADSDQFREPNDLAAVSLTGPVQPYIWHQSLYTLTFANPGTNTQSNYQVRLLLEDGTVAFSWAGPAIAPGATQTMTLPWIPEIPGPETLYGEVVLAGDQNPANDQTPGLAVLVQAVAHIGSGDQLAYVPLNMYYRTSLFETIYYAHEMNCAGQITAIRFFNNFSTPLFDIPTQIWLGETILQDLSGGWIPASQLTPVFSGDVDYPYGENEIVIPLATPFQYTGGNLVMLAYRPWDNDYYSSMDLFYAQTVGNNRSLATFNDNTSINPDNPPVTGVTGQFPATVFIFDQNGLGGLSGTVFSGGSPLNGATVSLAGTQLQNVTFDGGHYQFRFLPQGTYQVIAAKTGYTTVTQTVTVTEQQTFTLDFTLVPLTQVSVSGRVVGSNNPAAGLANASVTLTGYANYTATTNALGEFNIPGVYANQSYAYEISANGYQSQSGTINVGSVNYLMGDVILSEFAYPPQNVVAVEAVNGISVQLTWHPPVQAQEGWIHYDNGENFNAFGTAGSLSFDVAIRFPPDSLAAYAGTSLQAVKIWPAMGGNFKVRVWTGGSSLEPGIMVVDQPIIPVLNAWNTVLLDAPVPVTATEELWFGFLCDVTGVNPAYAGVDAGPAVNGFGNMIFWQGNWTTLLAVNSYCDFNWNIQGYLGFGPPPAPELTPLSPGRVKSVSFSAASGSPTREPERIVAYKVWRFLQGQANNEAAWTMLTPNTTVETTFEDPGWYALPDGTYYWAVKALYLNGVQSEPAFSNPLTKLTQVGTVAGIVRNAQNVPIAGAVVETGEYSATTNSIGAYTLLLPAGSYDFSCSAAGYATQNAAGIVVLTNQTTTLNFVLDAVDIDDSLSPVFETALLGNFPNPFNPETAVRFSLRESGPVWIGVYNLKGQLVATLVDETMESGAHCVAWTGRDAHGVSVASGVYIVRMRAAAYSGWHRIIILK